MKDNRLMRLIAASIAAALVLVACGADDGDVTAEEPAAPEPADTPEPADEPEEAVEPGFPRPPVYTDPSIADLDIVFERDRLTILVHTLPAQARLWPDVFDSVNVVYSEDPIAPLVGGAAWIVQAEPAIGWPALEQGAVDGVIVGQTNDTEAWYFMCREGFDSPEDLVGARMTGGAIGDSWITVGRIIARDFFDMDPDDMEWVSVSGGSDGRMEAALAGEVDCFMGQPRNLGPIEEAGGSALLADRVDNAQTQFIVTRDTWENHRDAVCAALEGHLEAILWLFDYEEEGAADKWPDLAELWTQFGYDPTDQEDAFLASYPFTLSRDMGASAAALDTQLEIQLAAEDPVVSPDFDWRDYVDFSCLWELQEAYGLPLRPDPNEM